MVQIAANLAENQEVDFDRHVVLRDARLMRHLQEQLALVHQYWPIDEGDEPGWPRPAWPDALTKSE